jgi:hypothetical protein
MGRDTVRDVAAKLASKSDAFFAALFSQEDAFCMWFLEPLRLFVKEASGSDKAIVVLWET